MSVEKQKLATEVQATQNRIDPQKLAAETHTVANRSEAQKSAGEMQTAEKHVEMVLNNTRMLGKDMEFMVSPLLESTEKHKALVPKATAVSPPSTVESVKPPVSMVPETPT